MHRVQLQEWLNQFPEDTVVQVVTLQKNNGFYGGDHAIEQELHGEIYEDYEYVDFNGNPYTTPDKPYYNKRYLTLGQSD